MRHPSMRREVDAGKKRKGEEVRKMTFEQAQEIIKLLQTMKDYLGIVTVTSLFIAFYIGYRIMGILFR